MGEKRTYSRKWWQKTFGFFSGCQFRLVQSGKMLWQSALRVTTSLCCCSMQIQEELQCQRKICPLRWIYSNTAGLAMTVKTQVSNVGSLPCTFMLKCGVWNVFLLWSVLLSARVLVACLKLTKNSEGDFQGFICEPPSLSKTADCLDSNLLQKGLEKEIEGWGKWRTWCGVDVERSTNWWLQ